MLGLASHGSPCAICGRQSGTAPFSLIHHLKDGQWA